MRASYVMNRLTLMWVALFPMLIPGYAQALSILSSSRSVNLTYSTGVDPSGYPILAEYSATDAVGFGPWGAGFDAGTTSVSQSSNIEAIELSGGAAVSAFWYYELARSSYRVVFSVNVLTEYSFGVDNVDTSSPPPGSRLIGPGGSVTLAQVDPSNPNQVLQSIYSIALGRDSNTGAGYPNVSEQGALAPGTYALQFGLSAGGTHFPGAPGAAGFAFVVIPEPQASLLIAFGLLGVAGWRRARA